MMLQRHLPFAEGAHAPLVRRIGNPMAIGTESALAISTAFV